MIAILSVIAIFSFIAQSPLTKGAFGRLVCAKTDADAVAILDTVDRPQLDRAMILDFVFIPAFAALVVRAAIGSEDRLPFALKGTICIIAVAAALVDSLENVLILRRARRTGSENVALIRRLQKPKIALYVLGLIGLAMPALYPWLTHSTTR